MKITWYGTAALRLENQSGRVLFDPYIRQYADKDKLCRTFRKENTILVTHGHFDHISHLYQIFGKRRDIRVYTTKTPQKVLLADGMEPEIFQIILAGEEMEINGFKVKALRGKHVRFDRGIVLKIFFSGRFLHYFGAFVTNLLKCIRYKEAGEILFWEFQAGEIRLQVMGSAAIADDVSYSPEADLLILAYQGRSDMATYIQPIIERLRPKRIMPIHFDDSFPPISSEVDMEQFERMMKEKFPEIGLMIPQLDVTYEI